MNDFMELALKRSSCRKYQDRPVDHELIVRCMEAARLSPSACNSQPWKYYIFTDADKRKAICDGMAAMHFNPFITQAPVIIALTEAEEPNVMPKLKEQGMSHKFAYFDLGLSVSHLILEAEELGLGTVILGLYPEEEIRKAGNIPDGDILRMVILLGWPEAGGTAPKKRLPLEDIAVWN